MTFFELVFSGFAIWGAVVAAILIGCVYADTHDFYRTGKKGWGFRYAAALLSVVVFLVVQHDALTFEWSLLTDVGVYLLAGLAYSLVEVVFTIFKAKAYWADLWRKHVKIVILDIMNVEDPDRLIPLEKEYATGKINETQYRSTLFTQRYGHASFGFVGVTKSKSGGVDPRIAAPILFAYVFDWALFWPFYAVNLVFGRVWNLIGNFFRTFTRYTAKLIFGNVFKL